MGEIKTITFQFNIFNTSILILNCLQELINKLLNLQKTYPIATNKSY